MSLKNPKLFFKVIASVNRAWVNLVFEGYKLAKMNFRIWKSCWNVNKCPGVCACKRQKLRYQDHIFKLPCRYSAKFTILWYAFSADMYLMDVHTGGRWERVLNLSWNGPAFYQSDYSIYQSNRWPASTCQNKSMTLPASPPVQTSMGRCNLK